jgi:hypothetical protein
MLLESATHSREEHMVGVHKTAGAALVCAAMVALGASSLGVVHADTSCQHWRFDGYTELDFADGGKFTFDWDGDDISPDDPAFVYAIPPNGGPNSTNEVYGFVGHNQVNLHSKDLFFFGGITDDGYAYGIAIPNLVANRGESASWRSAAPLRCADNGG